MTARHPDDRGLGAVERVRGTREQDSRIGLQRALAAQQADAAVLHAARQRLAGLPGFAHGTADDFLADRVLLTAMAIRVDDHRQQAEASLGVAEEARRRWQQDRTRLRAVQTLLERRADERRVERERREAAARDDLAGQGWLRRQSTPRTRAHETTKTTTTTITTPGGGR